MDDAPAFGKLAKKKGEAAMGSIGGSSDLPAAGDEGGIWAEKGDLDLREGKRAHLGAGVVFFLVTIAHGFPAARENISTDEGGRRVTRIAVHVTVNVAAVPGGGLGSEDGPNLGRGGADGPAGCRRAGKDGEKKEEAREGLLHGKFGG